MDGRLDDADLMRLIRERYDAGVQADKDNRDSDAEDRLFYLGGDNQWPSSNGVSAAQERRTEGRPAESYNRLPQFVKQVTGEIRQNKPAIKVLPNDGQTDPELAKVFGDIIRHIESGCDAHRTYAQETEKSVIGGGAWWRVKADYCGDSFDQDLFVEGIPNPNAVVCDPDARHITRKDMTFAFVTELVSKKKFEKTYPKVSTGDFQTDGYVNWRDGDFIRIAEYWEKREVGEKTIYAIDHAGGTETHSEAELREMFGDAKGKIEDLIEGLPVTIRGKRQVKQYEVRSRLVCGTEPLTDWTVWPGKFIPLVRVVGEEVQAGDRVVRKGLIRDAKADQMSYNYARNAAIEHVGLQPKAPFIGTTKQFAEHKGLWEQANRRNLPFLPYTPDPQAPGAPQRVAPPTMPSAIYQEIETSQQGMKASTGIYDASLGNKSNETSGVAIARREAQGDTGTYVFLDNMEAAITQTGNILVDLIPHYYDENRIVRVMGEDDEIDSFKKLVELMPDGKTWDDATRGSYDVIVTTGPAFASKRAEAAANLVELVRTFPALQQIGGDIVVKSLDVPYASELAERIKRTLPQGVDPKVDEQRQQDQQGQQQQPDPMQQMQQQLMMQQAEADIEDKKASAILKLAQAEAAGLKPQLDAAKLELDAHKTIAEHERDLAGLVADHHAKMVGHDNAQTQMALNHQQAMVGHTISAAGQDANRGDTPGQPSPEGQQP